ncbi:hypothetical protein OH76DRAFT_1411487 [Lentinus brumalis]|uniref:Uncharacterized protein n=1 Tax=Lentinus brumalis TaxID=2498619 RepID=A0A371CP93_9APHY|nr:hypothetical protein OH76DRAFT_1411487 [Polyporus brumalis]
MCDSFQGNTRAYTWKTNSWTEVLARISFGRRVAAVALGKYRDEKRKLNELYASRSQKHDHDSLDSRNALRRIPEPTEQKFLKEASSPRGQHIQTRGEPEALLRQLQFYHRNRIREGSPAAQVSTHSDTLGSATPTRGHATVQRTSGHGRLRVLSSLSKSVPGRECLDNDSEVGQWHLTQDAAFDLKA